MKRSGTFEMVLVLLLTILLTPCSSFCDPFDPFKPENPNTEYPETSSNSTENKNETEKTIEDTDKQVPPPSPTTKVTDNSSGSGENTKVEASGASTGMATIGKVISGIVNILKDLFTGWLQKLFEFIGSLFGGGDESSGGTENAQVPPKETPNSSDKPTPDGTGKPGEDVKKNEEELKKTDERITELSKKEQDGTISNKEISELEKCREDASKLRDSLIAGKEAQLKEAGDRMTALQQKGENPPLNDADSAELKSLEEKTASLKEEILTLKKSELECVNSEIDRLNKLNNESNKTKLDELQAKADKLQAEIDGKTDSDRGNSTKGDETKNREAGAEYCTSCGGKSPCGCQTPRKMTREVLMKTFEGNFQKNADKDFHEVGIVAEDGNEVNDCRKITREDPNKPSDEKKTFIGDGAFIDVANPPKNLEMDGAKVKMQIIEFKSNGFTLFKRSFGAVKEGESNFADPEKVESTIFITDKNGNLVGKFQNSSGDVSSDDITY